MSTTQRTAVHKRDRDDTFILAVSHTTTTVEHERHETAEQEEEEVKKITNEWDITTSASHTRYTLVFREVFTS